jgi:hypothetical protein
MSEPDYLPREEAAIKMKMYSKLLYREMKDRAWRCPAMEMSLGWSTDLRDRLNGESKKRNPDEGASIADNSHASR